MTVISPKGRWKLWVFGRHLYFRQIKVTCQKGKRMNKWPWIEVMIEYNTCQPTQLWPLSWTWATHDEPKRDDIQASSLQERSVPIIVPHVQEPTVGSRTKERKVLHGIKHSLLLLHEHMYAHKNLNKTYRLIPTPPLWDILGGSPRTSGRAGRIASSYKKSQWIRNLIYNETWT